MNRPTFLARTAQLESLFLRLGLSAAFLAAVSDRFGLWGAYGTPNVAWGDMHHFMAYTAKLNPWFPAAAVPAVGWLVTGAEFTLASMLLLGYRIRLAARLSGWLILAFAIGMTVGTGVKSALNASVFTASASSFLLARLPFYPLSVDARKGAEQAEEARPQ